MGGTTKWVREALAALGAGATVNQVFDYISTRDATVPKSHISLAMRKLNMPLRDGKSI